ncbi:MAG: Ada metal-binding domain-containing protein [Minisyncoccia bacterium]
MKNLVEKIKPYQDSLFLVVVIVLVGLIGFGLGRLSSRYQTAELKIQSTLVNTAELDRIVTVSSEKAMVDKNVSPTNGGGEVADSTVVGVDYTDKKIIGNKNSKIYHYEDCPGALKMKEGNKVFFASIIDAQTAGFRPAGNCPGLE